MMFPKSELEPHTKEDAVELRRLRQEAGLSASQLSFAVGSNKTYVTNLETRSGCNRSKAKWGALMARLRQRSAVKSDPVRKTASPRAHIDEDDLRKRLLRYKDRTKASTVLLAESLGVTTTTIRHFLAKEKTRESTLEKIHNKEIQLSKKLNGFAKPRDTTHAQQEPDGSFTLQRGAEWDFDFRLLAIRKVIDLHPAAKTQEQKKKVAALLDQITK